MNYVQYASESDLGSKQIGINLYKYNFPSNHFTRNIERRNQW